MLQGHVFHSFNRADLRTDGPFMLSQFFGGIGPAIFLVLTGITLAFLMDRREQQGFDALARWNLLCGERATCSRLHFCSASSFGCSPIPKVLGRRCSKSTSSTAWAWPSD
jgi:hypothetical protein